MSFKQLGEIIPKVLSETLQDPEQQKRIAETIAGFVTMPDREDTSDSAFKLGRLKQINLQNERRLQNQALAAEIQREKEAADLKYRRDLNLKEEEYFAKGVLERYKEGEATKRKADEIAGRKEVAKLKDRQDRRKTARATLANIDKGEGINFFTYFQQDGKGGFYPTPYLMEILKDAGHNYSKVESSKDLLANRLFQKYAKGILNNISASRSKKSSSSSSDKGSGVLGGPFVQFAVDNNVLPLSQALAPTANLKKNSTNLEIVQNESSRYLLTTSEALTTIFGLPNKFGKINFLAGLGLKPERGGVSSETLLQEYSNIRGLFNDVQKAAFSDKATQSNKSLQKLGSKLAGILERKGEAEYFKAALRSYLAPKLIQDGTVAPISKDASSDVTSYEIDYGLIVQNPILKALAVEFGIVTPEEIPNPTDSVKSQHSSKNTNASPTIVYASFSNAGREVGDFIQNVENQAAKFKNVDKALQTSIKTLQQTGFDSANLESEARKIYSLFEENNVESVSPYDVLVYLKLSSTREKEISLGSRFTKNARVYKIKGVSKIKKDGSMAKVFRDRADIDTGLNDIMQITSRISLLTQMDPEKFIQDVDEKDRKPVSMGSVASALKSIAAFRGILDEGVRALGLNTSQDNEFAKNRYEKFKSRLTKENRDKMAEVEDAAMRSQEKINEKYREAQKKTGGATREDYALYVKRSTLLWEKTALTYKLAGVVQGGTTGGRTISDSDFRIIYGNLWGGAFTTDIVSQAAITNLRKTTLETLLQRRAENILLQATGERMTAGGSLQQAALNVYRDRMDKFYKPRPLLQRAVFSRTRDGAVDFEIDTKKALKFRKAYALLNFPNKPTFSEDEILSYSQIDRLIKLDAEGVFNFTGAKGSKNFDIVKQYMTQDDSPFREFLLIVEYAAENKQKLSEASKEPSFEKLFNAGIQDVFVQLKSEMLNMKAQYRQYKRALTDAGNNAEAIQEIKERFSHVSIFDE